ncbi:hypothetical protein O3G_MSEX000472 [Manduca sexta]|nr:hypothetical protein O3G_MSEX000472 [Manduca sexta]
MNSVRAQITKQPLNYFKLINNVLRMQRFVAVSQFSTIDFAECVTDGPQHYKSRNSLFGPPNNAVQYFIGTEDKSSATSLSEEEINNTLLELISKNKDKQIENVVLNCHNNRKVINQEILKKLFRHYSMAGKPEIVTILQKYCAKVDPNLYKRNVEFLHYLAKAQCMKGNSERGPQHLV